MTNTFLISHSPDTGTHQLWEWNHDDPDNLLTRVQEASASEALGSGYQLTTVGSYLLFYKPPTSVTFGKSAYVDFTLLRLDISGSGPLLSVAQKGSWYWDKFTGDYSYTNEPDGEQLTDLQLMGITGYVLSRLSTPGRSSFRLWSFDAYNDAPGGSEDPIRVSMADPDAFPTIDDDLLIPIQNYVLVVNFSAQTWRIFSFPPHKRLPHFP